MFGLWRRVILAEVLAGVRGIDTAGLYGFPFAPAGSQEEKGERLDCFTCTSD